MTIFFLALHTIPMTCMAEITTGLLNFPAVPHYLFVIFVDRRLSQIPAYQLLDMMESFWQLTFQEIFNVIMSLPTWRQSPNDRSL